MFLPVYSEQMKKKTERNLNQKFLERNLSKFLGEQIFLLQMKWMFNCIFGMISCRQFCPASFQRNSFQFVWNLLVFMNSPRLILQSAWEIRVSNLLFVFVCPHASPYFACSRHHLGWILILLLSVHRYGSFWLPRTCQLKLVVGYL